MAQEPYPIGGGAPKVNVIASVDACDQGTGHAPGLGRIVDGPVKASKRPRPPEKIPASIAAGESPMPADREIDAPSRFDQFIGYLAAGGARAHHEDRAGRQRSGIAVLARVELNDIGGKAGRELRDLWSLMGAGGDHYVSRLQFTVIGENHVAVGLRVRPEREHVDSGSEGRLDPRAIVCSANIRAEVV